jgi:hypothetical protein
MTRLMHDEAGRTSHLRLRGVFHHLLPHRKGGLRTLLCRQRASQVASSGDCEQLRRIADELERPKINGARSMSRPGNWTPQWYGEQKFEHADKRLASRRPITRL